MPEKLLKFLLSELEIIRLRCQGTVSEGSVKKPFGAIIEIPLARLPGFFRHQSHECPSCGMAFTARNVDGSLRRILDELGELARDLVALKGAFEVEFVLKMKE